MKEKRHVVLSYAIILLLPLLSALIYAAYVFIVSAPTIESEIVRRIAVIGVPAALIIYYGYTRADKIVATLSGILFFPIFMVYTDILYDAVVQEYIYFSLHYWFSWRYFVDLLPLTLVYGLMGYFAARRTKSSLIISIFLGILVILLLLGID